MRVKEAAQVLGFSIDTLKRLEEEKRIPPPRRNHFGHRYYDQELLEAARAAYFSSNWKPTKRNVA